MRPIRSIDVYLPLDYNDARPIEEAKFNALEDEFLDRFTGVTTTHRKFPLQGLWKHGTEVFEDRVVVFNMKDFRETPPSQTYRYLERLKNRLKKQFRQLDVLITVQEMVAV